jgi:hypothetical protein
MLLYSFEEKTSGNLNDEYSVDISQQFNTNTLYYIIQCKTGIFF